MVEPTVLPSAETIRVTVSLVDGTQDKEDASGTLKKLLSPSPTVIASIGGIQQGCVLDTGAEASLIPSTIFHGFLEEVLGPLQKLPTPLMVVGVAETEVPAEGYVMAPVEIDGQVAEIGFLVVGSWRPPSGRKRDHPILLGCNALKVFADLRNANRSKGSLEIALDSLDIPEVSSREAEAYTNVEVEAREPNIPLEDLDHCSSEDGDSLNQMLDDNSIMLEGSLSTSADDSMLIEIFNVGAEPDESQSELKIDAQNDDEPDGNPQIFQLADGTTVQLPPGICLSTGNNNDDCRIATLLKNHAQAFANGEFDLGFCDLVPHEIRVSNETPIRLPYRRIPPTKMNDVKTLLSDLLEKEIIRRSSSPYASPVVLVPKKSGALRLCIDYRQLNAITVKDSFPLPRIEETLQALGGAKFFSSLDLSHGYFQVAMHPESIQRTAFRVPWGLFEFNRMPQGLCNSPSTFQRLMELIFGDINLTQVVLYLDDILVFSSTFEEHLKRLEVVFQRLTAHGLKIKGEKCQLFQKEVRHLGHVVNEDGV